MVIGALCSVLRRHESDADTEAIRAVLNIGQVVSWRRNPHYCANDPDSVAAFRQNVDSLEVKQLARQELIRRGLEA